MFRKEDHLRLMKDQWVLYLDMVYLGGTTNFAVAACIATMKCNVHYAKQLKLRKQLKGMVYLASRELIHGRYMPNLRAYFCYLKAFEALGFDFIGYGHNREHRCHPLVCMCEDKLVFFNSLSKEPRYMSYDEMQQHNEASPKASRIGCTNRPKGRWVPWDIRLDEEGDESYKDHWSIHLFFGSA